MPISIFRIEKDRKMWKSEISSASLTSDLINFSMRNKNKKLVNYQGNGSAVNGDAQQARGSKFGNLEFLKVQGGHGSLSVVLSIL